MVFLLNRAEGHEAGEPGAGGVVLVAIPPLTIPSATDEATQVVGQVATTAAGDGVHEVKHRSTTRVERLDVLGETADRTGHAQAPCCSGRVDYLAGRGAD